MYVMYRCVGVCVRPEMRCVQAPPPRPLLLNSRRKVAAGREFLFFAVNR